MDYSRSDNILTAVPEAQDAAPTEYIFSESAAEAVRRKWRQQQPQDHVAGTQRKITAAAAANPPDFPFYRKHTIVVSDAFPLEPQRKPTVITNLLQGPGAVQ